MTDDGESNQYDEDRRKKYDAFLHRPENVFKVMLHNDRLAGDTSLFCLKGALILNGAAALALISLYETLTIAEGNNSALIFAGHLFLSGLAVGIFSVAYSFFYQKNDVSIMLERLLVTHKRNNLSNYRHIQSNLLFRHMIIFCVISCVLFFIGGFTILGALGNWW